MTTGGRRLRRLRQRAWIAIFFLGAASCVALVALQPAVSRPLAPPTKVRICHATDSKTNPYVSEEPAIANNGDLQGGHLNHTGPVFPAPDWGDIIPPYTYVDQDGVDQVFPGYNWTPDGQVIWEFGCDPGKKPLTPIVECVEDIPGGGFLAHFGYDNPNDPIAAPYQNAFDPPPADRGQPGVFAKGRVHDAFQVESDGGPLTWLLTGNSATASSNSTSCVGSITVVKVLNPSGDPGRFNLKINGATAGGAAAVGDGGTTGTIAVRAGTHTISESAAPGTSLSRYDTAIVCVSGGIVVAQSNTVSVSVRVRKDQAVLCTITNTLKQEPKPVVPILECVVFKGGAPDRAVWGYRNDNAYATLILVGPANSFAPAPADRGQPQVFESGTWAGEFETAFNGAPSVAWTLGAQTVTASSSSTRCTATLELRKVTVPANDPGRFNLLLNGQTLATGGNGTTTGPVTVGVGEGTVSETAAPGTSLADYESSVDCTPNGTLAVTAAGTKVDGAVANGDVVVCTFTNRRLPTPPPPPSPTPPGPTPPGPTPPAGQVDLAVVKTAAPTTVVIGGTITWKVTVFNQSSVAAADVNAVKVSERPYRTDLISVTTSQGTCGSGQCDLGRLAPGASATITAVTRARQIGEILNVVRVGSEEQEPDYRNNVASALVRVVGPFRPPQVKAGCRTLAAVPRLLLAGSSSVVHTTARNRFGAPVSGVTVRMIGPGVDQRATTNRNGVARFTVTSARLGLIQFKGGALRAPTAAIAVCRTLLGVVTPLAPPITG